MGIIRDELEAYVGVGFEDVVHAVVGYDSDGCLMWVSPVFFCQAEEGIRDIGVTGVQTCALPIFISIVDKGLLIEGQTFFKRYFER